MVALHRSRRRAGALAVLVAGSLAVALPGSSVAQTNQVVTDVEGRAYALQSTGLVELGPLSEIVAPPCPQSAGTPELVNVGDALSAGLLRTNADCGFLGTPQGFIRMSSDVANVRVANPTEEAPNPLFDVGAVHTECTADLDGVRGFTSVANLNVAGQSVVSAGTFDEETDLSGVVGLLIEDARLVINEVVEEDEDSIVINGVHLSIPQQDLPMATIPAIDLILNHVECQRTLGPPPVTTTTLDDGPTTTLDDGGTTTTLRDGGPFSLTRSEIPPLWRA